MQEAYRCDLEEIYESSSTQVEKSVDGTRLFLGLTLQEEPGRVIKGGKGNHCLTLRALALGEGQLSACVIPQTWCRDHTVRPSIEPASLVG